MRRELYVWSTLRWSQSIPGPGYLKSRIGTASSIVYAWSIFMSVSRPCKSMASSHGFAFQLAILVLMEAFLHHLASDKLTHVLL